MVRYTIDADEGTVKQQPFTSLRFEELGLALESHPHSYHIACPTGEQEVVVKAAKPPSRRTRL